MLLTHPTLLASGALPEKYAMCRSQRKCEILNRYATTSCNVHAYCGGDSSRSCSDKRNSGKWGVSRAATALGYSLCSTGHAGALPKVDQPSECEKYTGLEVSPWATASQRLVFLIDASTINFFSTHSLSSRFLSTAFHFQHPSRNLSGAPNRLPPYHLHFPRHRTRPSLERRHQLKRPS